MANGNIGQGSGLLDFSPEELEQMRITSSPDILTAGTGGVGDASVADALFGDLPKTPAQVPLPMGSTSIDLSQLRQEPAPQTPFATVSQLVPVGSQTSSVTRSGFDPRAIESMQALEGRRQRLAQEGVQEGLQGQLQTAQDTRAIIEPIILVDGQVVTETELDDRESLARASDDKQELSKIRAARRLLDLRQQIDKQEGIVDSLSVNPRRYAQTASPLEKALLTLGAGLLGAAGRPEVGLRVIDNLVERDIRAQLANIQTKEAKLKRLRSAEYNARSRAFQAARFIAANATDSTLRANAKLAMADNLSKSLQVAREITPRESRTTQTTQQLTKEVQVPAGQRPLDKEATKELRKSRDESTTLKSSLSDLLRTIRRVRNEGGLSEFAARFGPEALSSSKEDIRRKTALVTGFVRRVLGKDVGAATEQDFERFNLLGDPTTSQLETISRRIVELMQKVDQSFQDKVRVFTTSPEELVSPLGTSVTQIPQ